MTVKKYILTENDVVDTLTSTSTDKPLSANQGRILKTRIQTGTASPETGFAGTPAAGDIYIKYAE